MNKHTLGPWSVEGSALVVSSENRLIAQALDTNIRANARLIAAAPQLLAALESLVLDADCDHSTEPDQSHRLVSVSAVEMARAVIAKARGES